MQQPLLPPEIRSLPLAIVGAGGVASYAHIPAYKQHALNVALLFDTDLTACHRASQALGGKNPPMVVQTTDKLIRSVEELGIAALDIAVPTPFHLEILSPLLAGLGEGCPAILAQKPLASSAASAATITTHCRTLGVKLGVNLNGRWVPTFRKMRHLVRDGAIGPVRCVNLTNRGLNVKRPGEWRGAIGRLIGYEMAVHHIDLLCWTFGLPSWVFSRMAHVPGFGVIGDNMATILLGFGEALTATVQEDWTCWDENSWFFHPVSEQLVVSGEQGTLLATPTELRLATRDTAPVTWTTQTKWFPDAFAGPMLDLLYAIGTGGEPSTDPGFHVNVLRVLEAAYESSDTNSVISLDWAP